MALDACKGGQHDILAHALSYGGVACGGQASISALGCVALVHVCSVPGLFGVASMAAGSGSLLF